MIGDHICFFLQRSVCKSIVAVPDSKLIGKSFSNKVEAFSDALLNIMYWDLFSCFHFPVCLKIPLLG